MQGDFLCSSFPEAVISITIITADEILHGGQ